MDDLAAVIDLEAIAASGVRLGVDPLGGAAVAYWPAIAERYGLAITITNRTVDPRFGFMTYDWDGQIRMDPSSQHAMARLIGLRSQFDLALGNDADADRFGVVTPAVGLLNPNHYLAAAAAYLFGGARDWAARAAIGKTLVSSSMQDRIAASLGRRLYEVPVGFKWFVDGLLDGSVAFGGEESAGMSFLRRDGQPWSTDKDGIIACLLAAEMTARTGRDPGESYATLTERFGAPLYRRIDAPATRPTEGGPGLDDAGFRDGHDAGGRAHHGQAHRGAGQRRTHRRAQGRDRAGLVRGTAVGHGERHQAVRGVLRRRATPGTHHRRSEGHPRGCQSVLTAPPND